jgi:hypothetical protein
MTTAGAGGSGPAVTASQASAALIPARPLAAQAHALRAAATLIEQAGVADLMVDVDREGITIQVPFYIAGPASRAAVVARLAAATGGRAVRQSAPGRTRGWVFADGRLAGHAVRIFTAIEQAP